MKNAFSFYLILFPLWGFTQSFSFNVKNFCQGDQVEIKITQQQIDSIHWSSNVVGKFKTVNDSLVLFKPNFELENLSKKVLIFGKAYWDSNSIEANKTINVYQLPRFNFMVEQYSNVKGNGVELLDSNIYSINLYKNYLPASIFYNVWTNDYGTIEKAFINDELVGLPTWKYAAKEKDFELKAYATNQFGCYDTFKLDIKVKDLSLRSNQALDSNTIRIKKGRVYEVSANALSPFSIEVFNLNGVSIYANDELRSTHFIEAHLANGIYLFAIRFGNGKTLVEKVVVYN